MANVIDTLVMVLGLDDRQYQEGQKRFDDSQAKMRAGVKKSSDEMGDRAKKLTESFGKLRNEIIGMFAVFTAGVGLKDFIGQTIETDAQIGRLAKNLDISTEELSAWQGVLRRSGGTAQDASNDLQTLVGAFQQIQLTGNSPLIPYLNLLKISLSDLKSPSETLLKISDAFSKMDPAQAAAIGKGMGLSPSMISLLERGRGAVQQMLAEQMKIGVVSKDDAAAAQELQNTLSSLAQASARLGRDLLTIVAPALNVMAKGLNALAEFAARNKPIMIGFFVGIAAAATLASLPLLGLIGEMLVFAAPFIAAGVAIGAFIEILMGVAHWFANLVRGNAQLRAAWAELSSAASGLGSAIADAFSPLMPVFHAIAQAVRAVGSAIGDTFGAAARAFAGGFVNYLVNQFHAVADMIRAITALVHGDLKGAAEAGRAAFADAGRAAGAPRPAAAPAAAPSPARRSAPPSQPQAGPAAQDVGARAVAMIKAFEGFISGAKFDRNAFRAGYGSDTVTDPVTGKVTKVTASTRVTRAEADADISRRVTTEFMPRVAAAVGAAWSRLSDATKAALTSIAYNYGRLPANVLRAARTGDVAAISSAIRARAADNGGINARRRYAEAAAVGGGNVVPIQPPALQVAANQNARPPVSVQGLAVGAAAQYAVPAIRPVSHTTQVQIDHLEIVTQAKDAESMARDAGPAIRKRIFVTQANSGLG